MWSIGDQIRQVSLYQQCFNLLTSEQYSLSAWFLDGRTSILVPVGLQKVNLGGSSLLEMSSNSSEIYFEILNINYKEI